jgi:hypothetical protein
MKYIVEMGSVAIIYIRSFINIGSGIQKFTWGRGVHRQTDTQRGGGDLISLLLCFKVRKVC